MSFSEFKDSFIIGVAYYDVGYQQTQTGTESAARQGVEKKA
jgi:hypothetical protein